MIPVESTQSLRGTDPADIEYISRDCAGDFASSARDVSYDGSDIRELRLVCQGKDAKFETYLTKIHLGSQVLYTLLRFDSEQGSKVNKERQSKSEAAAVRAANYVLEK